MAAKPPGSTQVLRSSQARPHTGNTRPAEIHIFTQDNHNGNGLKHGTFAGPPPKLTVDQGDAITWTLRVEPADQNPTFAIQFLNGRTPLVDAQGNDVQGFGPVAGPATYYIRNPDLNPTEYLYQVTVYTTCGTFSIDHCPVVDDSGD